MKATSFSSGEALLKVQGNLSLCGGDICLNIGGGTLPHIGAVAVAEPRPSLRMDGSNSASCSVLCILGHKDDVLAREAALRIATVTSSRTVVTVGMHIDCITLKQIEALTNNFWQIVDECLHYLA